MDNSWQFVFFRGKIQLFSKPAKYLLFKYLDGTLPSFGRGSFFIQSGLSLPRQAEGAKMHPILIFLVGNEPKTGFAAA